MSDLAKRIAALSPEKLALLELQLIQRGVANQWAMPIARLRQRGSIPLSCSQERLWFLHQLTSHIPLYNLAATLPINGNSILIEKSINEVVRRHEILRTTFVAVNGRPTQRVNPHLDISLRILDLQGLTADESAALYTELLAQDVQRPFDLVQGPLLRCSLAKSALDKSILLVTMHHAISDGWSLGIFFRELQTVLSSLTIGNDVAPLPELPIQFADFADWQQRWLASDQIDTHLTYWKAQLAGAPAILELPSARPRPTAPTFAGATQFFSAPEQLSDALRQLSRQERTTMFMTLLAAFSVLLFRYTQQTDLVVGSPIAGRTRSELEGLIGCFVNTLVLRVDLSGKPTFREVLQRVRAVTLDALAHQELPFEKLVEAVHPQRSLSHNPIFQVLFALQNTPALESDLLRTPGLPEIAIGTAKFDLSMALTETSEGLSGSVEYTTDMFDHENIARMIGHYKVLLTEVVINPDRPISTFQILSAAEIREFERWNETQSSIAVDQGIPHYFECQVAKTPHSTAVVSRGERLSYKELNERSNRLARYLHGQGVQSGDIVGICMGHSVDLIVSALAVLKTGAAYLPLDPRYPRQRLAQAVEEAPLKLVLTHPQNHESVPKAGLHVICLDDEVRLSIAQQDKTNPEWCASSDQLSYVICTSGSTGTPKLAAVYQRGFVNLLTWYIRECNITADDKLLVISSFGFDLTQKNLFAPLLAGAEVHLASWEYFDPAEVRKLIHSDRISLVNCTPSAFYGVVDASEGHFEELESVRHLVLGGEQISIKRLWPWIGSGHFRAEIRNTYGPTECSDVVSCYRLDHLERFLEAPVPIGRPISNVQLWVLDENQGQVPVGIVGEVCIGGAAVGAGYLNDRALTSQKFLPDCFSRVPDARIYRTGDMARYLPNGDLEFLGRRDHQMKLRGFRIELGEIEAAIRQCPFVQDVAVIAQEAEDGETTLAAYLIPDNSCVVLRNWLRMEREGQFLTYPRFLLPNGMPIVHCNRSETEFVYREMFEEEAYFRHGIKLSPGSSVFDVGANIGLFSVYAALHCEGLRITSFEPIPPLHHVLQLNMALYGVDSKLFRCGLGSQNGTVTFRYYPHVTIFSGRYADEIEERNTVRKYLETQQQHAGRTEEVDELLADRLASEPYECSVFTLSHVIREEQIESIDLLKIDVEKGEWDVLLGIDEKHWDLIRQIVMEVHDSHGKLDRVCTLLRSKGFYLAVEQDRVLKDIGLYNVYATRHRIEETSERDLRQASSTCYNPQQFIESVRKSLRDRLPEHLLPTAFVPVDIFPLTPSGKIDRNALKALGNAQLLRAEHIAPRSQFEERIRSIWAEILRTGEIGVFDNFFDRGGHSLLATQVIARVRDAFQIDLPLRTIFERPTIAELSAAVMEYLIDQTGGEQALESLLDDVHATSNQARSDNEMARRREDPEVTAKPDA